MPKLAILTHASDARNPVGYLVDLMVPVWRAAGIEVIWLRGPGQFVAADAVLLHVDLTHVAASYLALLKRYPVAINGLTGDISKRRISRQRVRRGDGCHGPVIVKTNLNYGGIPERLTWARDRRPLSALARVIDAARARLPWPVGGRFAVYGYPVFDSPRAVPWPAWWNPALVVERLLTERAGANYCVRRWVFLGSREFNQRTVYTEPVSKPVNVVLREACEPPPAELRAVRRELGFDYGKFDYAMVDGRPVLYDVNRTTASEFVRLEPRLAPLAIDLAPGIWDFLPGAP